MVSVVFPSQQPPQAAARPVISVVMANYRGAAWLGTSLRSVLAQSCHQIEVLLADDASDDDSVAIARGIGDARLRVLPSAVNLGPAATRNRALEAARGDWIAIVDSDDLIHPDRLQRLLDTAHRTGADIVADDLVHFGGPERRTLLQSLNLTQAIRLDAAQFMRSNDSRSDLPGYGYLKPLISRRVLGDLRYNTTLTIGEDFDLVMRMLLAGAAFVVTPDPLYAYRRHAGSISHRMTAERMAAMLEAHRRLPPMTGDAGRAAAQVDRQLARDLRYERLVLDIKAHRAMRVLPRLFDPAMLERLIRSLRDRRRRATPAARPEGPVACPPMPPTGQAWAHPPAAAAADIAAGRVPDPPQGWAAWLAGATGTKRN